MKFLFDYLPIFCFFVAYKLCDIFIATGVAIGASALQVIIYWVRFQKFEKIHLITFIMILLLGGSTLLFHDEMFIKWKPTVVYWIFSLCLLVSQKMGSKPLLERMLGAKIKLPSQQWKRLNTGWFFYFLLLGVANLWVVYHFDTNTWVNFKLFGTLTLTILFLVAQSIYMSRYMVEPYESS